MTAHDLIRAYSEGRDAADVVGAVNPYTPAPASSPRNLLARLWLSGRLAHAVDDGDL
ncbi:hypothetical protein IU433_14055 [Nocardia puris]|uniref:hypothetical protein n=1 Tax=Nocardia puris TaxID=208602 RepID=UPI001893B554|nr:hypothetical protein [Nocardia puris]MBF6460160.1 hypothetical protein [Nocardia puris]